MTSPPAVCLETAIDTPSQGYADFFTLLASNQDDLQLVMNATNKIFQKGPSPLMGLVATLHKRKRASDWNGLIRRRKDDDDDYDDDDDDDDEDVDEDAEDDDDDDEEAAGEEEDGW